MARLLLVEDDGPVRRASVRILVAEGHEVDEASTVAAARELIASSNYDRAILDVRLPDGDGLELTERHRSFEIEEDGRTYRYDFVVDVRVDGDPRLVEYVDPSSTRAATERLRSATDALGRPSDSGWRTLPS